MQAIQCLVAQELNGSTKRNAAVDKCVQHLDGVELRRSRGQMRATARPTAGHEAEWSYRLRVASAKEPFSFTPPVTEPGDTDRHPWDGLVGECTVTDLSSGCGLYAACFEAAGASVECAVRQSGLRQTLVESNAPNVKRWVDGLGALDPHSLEWTHGLFSSPAGQPFSVAGKQQSWQDDRAFGMIQTLRVMAAMQPWWCWIESVPAIRSVDNGQVWQVIQGIARLAGFSIDLHVV